MVHCQLAQGLTSSGTALLEHPAPTYPTAMLVNCPAEVELRVLLIVGENGAVEEVRLDHAPTIAPAFAAAVRAAAMGWRYEPLVITHSTANANKHSHAVDREAKPFSLPYAFRFACHAGKAEVSSSSSNQH